MGRSKILPIVGLVGCLDASSVYGGDTITVAARDETPDQIVSEITLPASASDGAPIRAAIGRNAASEARDRTSATDRDVGEQVSPAPDLDARARQDVRDNQRADAAWNGGRGRP